MTWEGLRPPYGAIVVDPPWQYMRSSGLGGRRAAANNYTTMTNAQIASLPVCELAADASHCYLWVTVPRMFGERGEVSPIEILEGWGFTWKTMLTWVKTGPPGMGFYFRGNTEHVLFGVRGDCPIPPDKRMSNVCSAPRRGHSEKPGSFYDIVQSVSPGPYVELFARQPALGWDSWGYGYESPHPLQPERPTERSQAPDVLVRAEVGPV